MKKEKYKDVIYCFKCKKYIVTDDYVDSQNFHRCPKCMDVNFPPLVFSYDEHHGFCIEEQDNIIINFYDLKELKSLINKILILMKKAKQEKKTKGFQIKGARLK